MSHSVSEFITRLEDLHKRNPDIARNMSSYSDLIESLQDLDAMIGMTEAKSSILLQLKSLIVKSLQGATGMNVFEDQMLHTVITGPPGVGKTELGKILARIWQALGILKGTSPKKKKKDNSDDLYAIYNYALRKSQEALIDPLRDLNTIAKDLSILSRSKRSSELKQYSEKIAEIQHETMDRIEAITLEKEVQKEPVKPKIPFKVVSRVDFVAGYVGQTAIKTEKILKESVGGVLFIDEAYSLIHGKKDDFGMEALTTINQFMSENPDKIIVIFAGYKELMDEGIFKRQPGLKSRCSWHIDIKGYTGEDLAKIFTHQLIAHEWSVHESVDLAKFFDKHLKDFPDFGRNTSKFLFYCKLYHMDAEFIQLANSKKRKIKDLTKVITSDTLDIALKKYQLHLVGKTVEEDKEPPFGFYS